MVNIFDFLYTVYFLLTLQVNNQDHTLVFVLVSACNSFVKAKSKKEDTPDSLVSSGSTYLFSVNIMLHFIFQIHYPSLPIKKNIKGRLMLKSDE